MVKLRCRPFNPLSSNAVSKAARQMAATTPSRTAVWIPRAAVALVLSAASPLLFGELPTATAFAQDVRATLFRDADRARERAEFARAELLAPKTFGEAMRAYRRAAEDLQRGRDLEDIRKRLDRATQLFDRAEEAAELASAALVGALEARADALNAEAHESASQLWNQARARLDEAARELEDGDIRDARRKSDEAQSLFRQAELAAIKASFLDETWRLLAEADRLEVEKLAPTTLRRAQELVREAERELTDHRYDTDRPRSLAREAEREARHAIFLASRLKAYEDEEETPEDLLLAAESELQRVVDALDLSLTFAEGIESPTDSIIRRVKAYQDTIQMLRSALAGREEMVASLEARVDELEERLGGVEEERSALTERVAAQARLQQRFATLERLFNREEARVIREGDDVIIRLIGLTFPVGSADIDSRYHPLLDKVRQAIAVFPRSQITIEGHTDSFGSDRANLQLSQERADAVRGYLLADPQFQPAAFESVGHGETRPVASNDSAEGRAKNRRIDVIIRPDVSTSF